MSVPHPPRLTNAQFAAAKLATTTALTERDERAPCRVSSRELRFQFRKRPPQNPADYRRFAASRQGSRSISSKCHTLGTAARGVLGLSRCTGRRLSARLGSGFLLRARRSSRRRVAAWSRRGVSEASDRSGSVFEGKVTLLRHEPNHHRLTARVQVLTALEGRGQARAWTWSRRRGLALWLRLRARKVVPVVHARGTRNAERGTLQPQQGKRFGCGRLCRARSASRFEQQAPAPRASAAAEPVAPAPPDAATPTPTPQAPPAPLPAPVPEPTTASTPSGRGGCAGCSAPSTAAPPGCSQRLPWRWPGSFGFAASSGQDHADVVSLIRIVVRPQEAHLVEQRAFAEGQGVVRVVLVLAGDAETVVRGSSQERWRE